MTYFMVKVGDSHVIKVPRHSRAERPKPISVFTLFFITRCEFLERVPWYFTATGYRIQLSI